jgi:hypothetical protein
MDETTGTFLDEPALPGMSPPAAEPGPSAYRVLARK